ncbi:hypothetical protein BLA18110_07839 [Burkholderia lata]|uniref:hypothetical protein n=1 Tax=Burkholderia lata (strain ATCC 17760 / DSM 23089 / LMG 22485 / NCIMB 9086 / R18194 / 383) TaxID=482957 RepID=UPI001453262E|nr:hypothetical protein [Burkholderia lata]VWD53133.1 hypothetical protein BLA18110_07839 [Burkholderia lata]
MKSEKILNIFHPALGRINASEVEWILNEVKTLLGEREIGTDGLVNAMLGNSYVVDSIPDRIGS